MAGYLNTLAGTMAGSSVAKQTMSAQKLEKPKRSFGEMVGRVGDILAIMGGREPVYEFYQQQRAAENAANAQREGLMGFVTGQQTPQDVARLIGLGIDIDKINALRTAGGDTANPDEYLGQIGLLVAAEPPERQQALWDTLVAQGQRNGVLPPTPLPFGQDTVMAAIARGKQTTNYLDRRSQRVPVPAEGRIATYEFGRPTPETMQAFGMAPPQQPQGGNTLSMADLQRIATGFPTAEAMMGWMQRNNITVRVSSPQEAMNLPRGTRLILPDGSPGVVP